MAELTELGQFLLPPQRIDVRAVALVQVLGLTGSAEGVATLRTSRSLLEILVRLLVDPAEVLATDAFHCLINLSADVATVPALLEIEGIVNNLYKVTTDLSELEITKTLCSDHSGQGEQAGRQGHTGALQPDQGPGQLRQGPQPAGERRHRGGQSGQHPVPGEVQQHWPRDELPGSRPLQPQPAAASEKADTR